MEKIKKFLFSNTSIKQTVTKNMFWLSASEIVGRLLKMGLVIYAARILGAEGWGIFSYVLSIGSLLVTFSDLGISDLLTREIAQKQEGYGAFITTGLFIKIIVLCVSTLLVIYIGPYLSNIPEGKILFPLIGIILFFDSLRDLGLAINRAFEKMEREMIVKMVMSIVILILGIFLLKLNPAPESIAVAYAIGGLISVLIVFFLIQKEVRILLSVFTKQTILRVIKTTAPFALIALITTIIGNTDIFMLGIWKDSTEIGFYASAQRIQQFILIIPSMFASATFPMMSRITVDKQKFRNIFEKSLGVILMTGIPLSIGGILLSKQIIYFVFGATYHAAIPIFIIFMIMLVILFPFIFLSNAIFAYNKQKELLRAYSIGILITILLNIILIPKFGAIGAAIATCISTLFIVLILWHKMKKINYFTIKNKLNKIIVATIAMSVLVMVLQYLNIALLLNILISTIVYFYLLTLLKEPLLQEFVYFYKK